MTETQLKLTVPAKFYQDALFSQTACNLSGIVHSLSRTMEEIWKEARENNLGTDYVNQHPICRLYAEQIAFLSGAGTCYEYSSWYEAHKICEERANG